MTSSIEQIVKELDNLLCLICLSCHQYFYKKKVREIQRHEFQTLKQKITQTPKLYSQQV